LGKTPSKKLKAQAPISSSKTGGQTLDKLKIRNFGGFVGRSDPKSFYEEQQEYLKSLQRKYGRSCTKQGAITTTNTSKRREEKAMVAVTAMHMFFIVAVATSGGNPERNTWRGGLGGEELPLFWRHLQIYRYPTLSLSLSSLGKANNHPSIQLFIHPSIHPSIYLSIYLSL